MVKSFVNLFNSANEIVHLYQLGLLVQTERSILTGLNKAVNLPIEQSQVT